jgi:hypothetical protein
VHLLLFVQSSFIIALLSTLLAKAAFPRAYLFERGGNNLWAPVLLHLAEHAIPYRTKRHPRHSRAMWGSGARHAARLTWVRSSSTLVLDYR